MKNPQLPSQVKIAGMIIQVEEWDHKQGAANMSFGIFSRIEQSIKIDVHVHVDMLLDTFLHEVNHAIYWIYSLREDDDEERVVSIFATAWAQIFVDNPEVLTFIKKCRDKI